MASERLVNPWLGWRVPARAWGDPLGVAGMREQPEDFVVDELPLVEPDGDGEHLLLLVEKRDSNSEWVARQLARVAGIANSSVGFAGLKDRRAVTRQWYSLHLPGKGEPDFSALDDESIRILEQHRHRRKLRRGALRGNRFRITLRPRSVAQDQVDERLRLIASGGVPNYFGQQRFGRDGSNLDGAAELLVRGRGVDRHRRGLYLSAARSLLFNALLDQRVADGSWNRLLAGELVSLAGSRSLFVASEIDQELERRLEMLDLHPTGPLWGESTIAPEGDALVVEQRALAPFTSWADALVAARLSMERRPLRLIPGELEWSWRASDRLTLGFTLPPGGYATAVIAEIFTVEEPVGEWVDSGDV